PWRPEGPTVLADRPPARRPVRQDHRGVRRVRLSRERHAEPHQSGERSARVRQADADQRRHRPDRRHREWPHPEPQSEERRRAKAPTLTLPRWRGREGEGLRCYETVDLAVAEQPLPANFDQLVLISTARADLWPFRAVLDD